LDDILNKAGFSYYDLALGTGTNINVNGAAVNPNGTIGSYTPFIVANFTSKLVLSKGRNVAYYN
jgi:hypothetical protein